MFLHVLPSSQIEAIPTDTFRDLINLNFLELTSNRILKISYRDFINMGNLRSLFLGQNLITEIENKTFIGKGKEKGCGMLERAEAVEKKT